jgi:imipenem/basic amino acid-specific outer membrane pore
MKFTKLSLAALAALSIATAATAADVKVDGQIKLWYQTVADDNNAAADSLFEKNAGATGDLVGTLGMTGNITKNTGFGMKMYTVTSAGLENNLVDAEAIQLNNAGTTNGTDAGTTWIAEAYLTHKMGNTLAKIGRQTLDTPLAFTETWNAAPNTFEAAVLINSDIKDFTLVGAYVSRGNSTADILATQNAKTVAASGDFATLGTTLAGGATAEGAYALGVVTTAIPATTAQAWYYDIPNAATAYWLQTDSKVMGLGLGLQYANLSAEGKIGTAIAGSDGDTTAFAAQVSGAVSGINLSAAYSNVSEGTLAAANTATGFVKTKLHTASILSDGRVAALPDTTAWKVAASTKVADYNLGASYGSYSVGLNANGFMAAGTALPTRANTYDPKELDLSVSTKLQDINLAVYYVNQAEYSTAKKDREAVRIIASIDF